jgi:hypothetical protein
MMSPGIVIGQKHQNIVVSTSFPLSAKRKQTMMIGHPVKTQVKKNHVKRNSVISTPRHCTTDGE